MAETEGPAPRSKTLTEDDECNFTCLYFGYASNLSPRTIQQRCPGSLYIGLAVLRGWKFIISAVGFGNIVQTDSDGDVVYGTLSFLTGQHESALDKSEEVPHWHQKRCFKVRMLEDGLKEGREVEATTYVDVERTTEGVISKEYLVWMRKAIADGLQIGVPKSYFDKYIMRFLPEDGSVGHEDKIMMLRTVQVDREDLRFVPGDVMRMTGTK